MKMTKIKKLLAAAVLGIFAVGLTGCGEIIKADVVLTSGTTANYSMAEGFDDEFFEAYDAIMGSNGNMKETFKEEITAQGGTISEEVIDGVTYTMATVEETGASLSEVESQLEELLLTDICLTKDYFYGVYDPSIMDSELSGTGLSTASSDEFTLYETLSITFTAPVTKTNGTIDPDNPNCVTWEHKSVNTKATFWATTSTAMGTAKTTSVKNNKIYNKKKTIKITNASNLARMTLGKKDSDGYVISTKTIKAGAVVKANGSYELTIWSKNGKCQKVNFTIDKMKPTISGAKDGKTYKKNVTLKFSDAHSGIKSVTVNGKKISAKKYSGYTIKKNGKYKIVVTDKAGNKKKITIWIKK